MEVIVKLRDKKTCVSYVFTKQSDKAFLHLSLSKELSYFKPGRRDKERQFILLLSLRIKYIHVRKLDKIK